MKKLSYALALASLLTAAQAQNLRQVSDYERLIDDHYRPLSGLSRAPQPAFAALDTITFPMAQASAMSVAARSLPTVFVQDFRPAIQLAAPPANSSAQTRGELDYLLRLQTSRKPDYIRQAQELAEVYYIPQLSDTTHPHYAKNTASLFFIGQSLGGWFNARQLPQLAALLARVHQDASHEYYTLKYQFKRPRPYQLDSRLAVVEQAGSPAYPSSHGAALYINAYLFSRLEPQMSVQFLTAAFQMAKSREILGVDYPSDGEAGRAWARAFVRQLIKHPAFEQAWKQVRVEWKKGRRQHTVQY